MFHSILLAGFVWATANATPAVPLLPHLPAGPPAVSASLRVSLPAAPAAEDQTAREMAFVVLINAERTERGLSALTPDPMLTATARAHSEEMCAQDYFDHQSPTPGLSSPMDRYLASSRHLGLPQPEYLLVGENIFYCSVCNDVYNVDYAHRALMASPGHRANILEPRFAKVGIGVYRNPKGEFWVTEMFSRDRNP